MFLFLQNSFQITKLGSLYERLLESSLIIGLHMMSSRPDIDCKLQRYSSGQVEWQWVGTPRVTEAVVGGQKSRTQTAHSECGGAVNRFWQQ